MITVDASRYGRIKVTDDKQFTDVVVYIPEQDEDLHNEFTIKLIKELLKGDD